METHVQYGDVPVTNSITNENNITITYGTYANIAQIFVKIMKYTLKVSGSGWVSKLMELEVWMDSGQTREKVDDDGHYISATIAMVLCAEYSCWEERVVN